MRTTGNANKHPHPHKKKQKLNTHTHTRALKILLGRTSTRDVYVRKSFRCGYSSHDLIHSDALRYALFNLSLSPKNKCSNLKCVLSLDFVRHFVAPTLIH